MKLALRYELPDDAPAKAVIDGARDVTQEFFRNEV